MINNHPADFSSQPRSSIGSRIGIILIIITILIIILSINEIYFPHPQFSGIKTIDIPSGFGSRMIGDKLKAEGFIRSKWMFVTYVSLRGEASSLKPGTYDFQNASIPFIAQALVKGAFQEKIITLPEGNTIDDLARILQDQHITAAPVFTEFAAHPQGFDMDKKYPFLPKGIAISGLEGYLFPDTYHIFKNASTQDIADTFLQNFDKKLTPQIRDDISHSGKTLHEIIIMASLIEKEVVSDQDRKMVSGILLNRLRLDIPLQVDATIYYLKKQQDSPLSPNNHISLTDLAIDSPYNTYKYRGLPAGPIGNPGLSAIMAAIHPIASAYLYYLSTPDGRTIFSKTLAEHNMAKQKYLTK